MLIAQCTAKDGSAAWSHTITVQLCVGSPAGTALADTSNVMCRQAILFCVCLLLGSVTTLAVAWACATWSQMSEQPPVAFHVMSQDNGWWFSAQRLGGFGAKRRELAGTWARTDAKRCVISQFNTIRITKDHFIFQGYLGLVNTATIGQPEPPVYRLPIDHTLWSRLGDHFNFDNQSGEFVDEEGAFGWPMLAMWCSYNTKTWVLKDNGTRTWQPARNESLFQPSASLQRLLPAGLGDRPLPLRPIAMGFATDTSLYSFAWLFLGIGANKARRSRRRAKGQCEHCVYDLRGTSSDRCPECGNVSVLR